MFTRIILLACIAASALFSQNSLKSFTFGGSGIDSANGVTVDSSGNIYVVGTTTSYDLPVVNAEQPTNPGTQVIVSQDAGATWSPLASLFPAPAPGQLSPVVAADPSNAQTVYAGFGDSVCRSVDGGTHFQCFNIDFRSTQPSISSLVVDPQQPSTLYVSASPIGGIYKSADGGQTWVKSRNFPHRGEVDSVSIDPFHPNILYAWIGFGAYISQDGAVTWVKSNLPWPENVSAAGGFHFSFDPVTPGIVYGPAFINNQVGFQKSTDGGQTWTPVSAPFSTCCVVPDPKVSGVLYALVGNTLWKSSDGGAMWNATAVPQSVTGPLSIDPSNTQILLAGGYRSTDGGQTWTLTNASRAIQASFGPAATNTVYAAAPITSDAFLAKFLPDGKTLVFLTYFGGMGNEIGQSIALDSTGNIWIAGSTSSVDLPVTTGAFQTSLKGQTNGFIAKFTNSGKLAAASFLGGSSQDSIFGVALSPQGNPWVIGSFTSSDFPFTASVSSLTSGAFIGDLDAAAAHVSYLAPVDGTFDAGGKGIAIDSSGNVNLTGTTSDPNFSITAGTYHAGIAPSAIAPQAFVLKLEPSGQTVYSTYIGGSQATPGMPMLGESSEGPLQHGIGVTTDSAGNAVVAGYTASADFPTTPGAYQTAIAAGCPYPTLTIGTIGPTIFSYLIDDTFVLKLSADGTTLLYSTLLGGSCYDHPTGIALDAAGDVFVTGETDSNNYPLVDAVEAAPALGAYSSFVSEFNPSGASLIISTFLLAGKAPSVAVTPGSSIAIAGDVGAGAQTQQYISPFFLPVTTTHANLAILSPPSAPLSLNLTQVTNAFSLLPGPVAPGEIVSLGVTGLASGESANIGLNVLAPLATDLAGVQVSFDGRPAYLVSVGNGKVVCIAPIEIAGQASTAIQVSANGAMSSTVNAPVAATALGLLTADGSGTGAANARNADGSLNGPNNPAPAGTTVTVFLTGVGVTNPPEMDGAVPASSSNVPVAKLSAANVTPKSIHPVAGFVPGLFALDFLTPANPPAPTLGVAVSSSSSESQFVTVYLK